MKGGNVVLVSVLLLGVLTAYLLSDPVPEGITEPAKYRFITAVMRLVKLVISVAHVAHRDIPYEAFYVTSLKYTYIQSFVPAPHSEVAGSNVRARVMDMDGVNVVVYEPIRRGEGGSIPGFVYIHGGGMCIGDAAMYDPVTRRMAEELGVVVVSINYRLAPEHTFPAGHEDCMTATRYFINHAHDFDVDPQRIGIGGDSAGGHLSASVAQSVHDDPSVHDLKLQVLVYPSMQKIDLNTPSYQKASADFGNGGILPLWLVATFASLDKYGRLDHEFFTEIVKNNHTSSTFKMSSVEYAYVNHAQLPDTFRDPKYYTARNNVRTGNDALWARLSSQMLDARSAPLMRRDLTGLPPAFILTCGFDPLRDDGVFYKNRLENASVPVTWSHYESGFHGIFQMQGKYGFKIAVTMLDDIINFLEEHL